MGIRCNIWARAAKRRHIVHSLEGGGEACRGYNALRHEYILRGDAGRLGVYPILAFLPDKVCRFLYEFHAFRFESLGLPPVPDDGDEVHRILRPDQLNALLRRIKVSMSERHAGHFRLFNVLVIGHTKYSGVQRVYCEPFPNRKFHGYHRQDLVFCRPPGIQHGDFVLSADSVFYCRVLLLFSMVVATDTGDKTFECAMVSVLETYSGPLENGTAISLIHSSLSQCNHLLTLCLSVSLPLSVSVSLSLYSLRRLGFRCQFQNSVRTRS